MEYLSVEPRSDITLSEVSILVNQRLVTRKGTLAPYYARPETLQRKPELMPIFSALRFFFPSATSLSEAVYQLRNSFPQGCKQCLAPTVFIDMKRGYRDFCSSRCNGLFNAPSRNLTEAQRAAKSSKQSLSTKGRKMTLEWRNKLSEAARTEDVQKRKAATCLERYGVENPGVLGAYSSRAAREFIERFIDFLSIDRARCLYHDGGNTREFYRNVEVSWSEKSDSLVTI
jgi:hypothetical protein